MVRMVQHWESKRDPLGGRLWGIFDSGAPLGLFLQQLVVREQRAGMTIGTHAKQDQVKDRVTHRIPVGKRAGQLRDVVISYCFRVFQVWVDWVDVLLWDVDMVEELLLGKKVVGVFVLERHAAFIRKVDNPLGLGKKKKKECMSVSHGPRDKPIDHMI